ncbi:MAG: hypothetical protein HY580_03920 [Nitrospinae bacterium]|nr:hypothetical protein [Nitrospinota bacterium]
MTAPLHWLDRLLYLEGAHSGYGIAEAAEFLRNEARESPAVLLVPMKMGNPQEGLTVYLWRDRRVRTVPVPWPSGKPEASGDAFRACVRDAAWGGTSFSPSAPDPCRAALVPRTEMFPVFASIYHKRPFKMEKTADLRNVYFAYPYTTVPENYFTLLNPDFAKVWSRAKPDKNYSVDIFKRRDPPEPVGAVPSSGG